MGNLASTQLNTQSDPALVLQQALANREKQYASIANPQQQLAARLGGLLGGGIVNVAQDRGFFDVNDPLLAKVSQIQGVYNDVASRIDPASDPAKFYSELQKAYSDAGLGREALAAAQEAQKAKASGIDFQLKETQLFEKNPELLAGRITQALESNNEPEAMRLANLNARLTEDRDLTIEAKKTAIAKDRAYISYQNKLANDEKFEYKPVDPSNPLAGNWKFDKSGKTDPQYVPVPAELAAKFAPPSKDSKKSDKEKAPLNTFETNTTTPPAASSTSSAAAPAAPVSAPQVDPSTFNPAAYNQNAGTYRLDADPIIKMISDYAGQNRQLLETNPEFAKSITAAYENRKQELSRLMGTGVRFQ
jgi:chemotaxis protein histidine kinase CheA